MRRQVGRRVSPTFVPLLSVWLSVALSGQSGASQSSTQLITAAHPPPGLLETFLKKYPGADKRVQFEGALAGGSTKAAFHAVVAWDRSQPGKRTKGLIICIEESPRVTNLYLDDDKDVEAQFDNLREFQERLLRFAGQSREELLASFNARNAGSKDWAVAVSFQNRPGNQEAYCCPRFTVLNVGYYGVSRKEISGMYISAATPPEPPYQLEPNRTHRFPGTTLGPLIEIVKKARAFLDAQ